MTELQEPERKLVRPVMPELDTVRGIAILMVLLYHGFAWSQGWAHLSGFARFFVHATLPGWLGVNLFFVLSGFLITGILMGQRGRPGYYRNFYIRRALRILPACYALLVILWLIDAASWPFLALSALYLSNVAPLFGVPVAYGPLWSLAVEEHFYLLWPTAVRHLSRRVLGALALTIVVASPLLRAAAFLSGVTDGVSSYTWLVADGLAVGGLLAVVVRDPLCTRRRLAILSAAVLSASVAAMAVGAPFGILTRQRVLGAALQVTPWNLAFAALIGFMLLLGTSRWAALASPRFLRFFGEISYGLYLFHLLPFWLYDRMMAVWQPGFGQIRHSFAEMLVRFIVAAGLATLVAWISRQTFEAFFLNMKDRMAPHGVRTAREVPLSALRAQPTVAGR